MDKKINFPLKKSIGIKLIRVVLSIYIVVTLAITIGQMIAEFNSSKKDLKRELERTAISYEEAVALAMFNENEEGLFKILSGMLKLPSISAVSLKGDFRINPDYMGEYFDEKKMFFIEKKIFHVDDDGEKIYVGKMTLMSKENIVFTRVKYGFILIIVSGIIKSLLLIFLFIYAFKKILIKPFIKLAECSNQTNFEAMEIFSLGFKKGEENEFTVVEKSMNDMIRGLKSSKMTVENSLKKVSEMNLKLEDKIQERTKEISEYMDNMTNAVFAIDSDFRIIKPVSRYTEKIFGEKIEGKSIFGVLFSQFKRKTQEFVELTSTLSMVFGHNEMNFLALEYTLPQKIIYFNPKKGSKSIFKIKYIPLFDKNNNVNRLLFIVDDITDYDHYYFEALRDQIKFQYLDEVLIKREKVDISTKIETCIEESMSLLEDFISPMSDSYTREYFEEGIKKLIKIFKIQLNELDVLKLKILDFLPDFDVWGEQSGNLNFQLEASDKLSKIMEQLILYANAAKSIFTINFKIKDEILNILKEKEADLHKVYKNLFEYIFLIREIDQIDEEKLTKAVNTARLYPDFERTMSLIYQRSKFISLIYRILMDELRSDHYNNLAELVKALPQQRALNAKLLKHNLLDPYSEILEMGESS